MSDLQSADEVSAKFTAVRNLGKLVLKVVSVRLEAVDLSHFDSEEVVVILLSFLTGGILCEKSQLFLKIVERMR